MQRKRVTQRASFGKRGMPGDQLGRGDQMQRSRGQHRHVQRLADMAGVFGPPGVLVEQAAARREIQQHGARDRRHRAVPPGTPEYGPRQSHRPISYSSTPNRPSAGLCCKKCSFAAPIA